MFSRDRSKHPCQRPPCYFAWGCFRYFSWKREPRRPLRVRGGATRSPFVEIAGASRLPSVWPGAGVGARRLQPVRTGRMTLSGFEKVIGGFLGGALLAHGHLQPLDL